MHVVSDVLKLLLLPGSGVFATSATLIVTGTTFSSNIISSYTAYGGGAYLSSCTTTMSQCVFSNNIVDDRGGGLFTTGGTTTMNRTQFESNYASTGGGWYVANGVAALTSPYFVSNTGTLGYRDMHRAAGTVTFKTSCPGGKYFFGKDVLDCYDCSSIYYPKDMRDEGCMPWTSYETAGMQDELESAIFFNRTIALTADIQLSSGVALLTKWRDRSSLLQGVVFDGQVGEQRSL